MNKLSKKDMVLISLMLFSLFFGAGNLIFPPFLGESAGTHSWVALAGFFVTAVGFPVMGVVAVAKSKGLMNLGARVSKVFALVFTVLIYLSIGPCLGIPRAGSLPFEMAVLPYLSQGFSVSLARFLYTLVFFSVALWLSFTPSKLVDRLGKVLTPLLLVLIALLFVASILKPMGAYDAPIGNYVTNALTQGFLDGYQTMDTIAALNFGIVISVAIKSRGVKNENAVVSYSIKAGIAAGTLLMAIYAVLCHLGASSGAQFAMTENGAETLTNVTNYIFGGYGAMFLAVVFTLACLTTSVGLVTSCSAYFSTLTSKVSYKMWTIILSVWSMVLANMGLTKILAVSVPVLTAIYPIAIMLILLAMIDKYFKSNYYVYKTAILFTGLASVVDALNGVNIKLGVVTELCTKLPLFNQGLCWVVPAFLGIVVGVLADNVSVLRSQKGEAVNYK
ncbi:branched-chain amino acid transport system II carrier protein [Clostridium sp. BJN0001]|uniref:branched-chain amino acid transport system II carrier protein n=1 Tax=Clostridium sp. BJN0001 TaxID=2930219 RepID=UPI001FD154E3|nr:branched-chain amino acid transport system II carrier protein [Clostridium sp. BJN0001]